MKTIDSFRDLEEYGIKYLTGESCAYGLRVLCDVTERGKGLIEAFLGNRVEVIRDKSWNHGNDDDPNIGTVMLTRGMLRDLGAFILLYTRLPGEMVVMVESQYGEYPAIFDAEHVARIRADLREYGKDGEGKSFWDYIKTIYHVSRYLAKPEQAVGGDRNQHQMSGRLQ
jgi:hypothetical protein